MSLQKLKRGEPAFQLFEINVVAAEGSLGLAPWGVCRAGGTGFRSKAMKYIFFFATPADIKPVLKKFEVNVPMKFVECDMRAAANRPIYLTSCEIPQLGFSTHETGSASTTYMVSYRDSKNQMYAFRDDSGHQKWLLSNGDNEQTTLLTPAGLWTTGTLLPGNMSTMHNTPVAQQLMRWFLSALKQEDFAKFGIWWLGRNALAMLKEGKRLVQAEQSPPQFDLKWPGPI